MGESLPPKRKKKESRSFQSPGKTESKIDEQSTLERVSRVHRRADSKRENTRWFFYAHKKLIHHHHHHHLLAAPKIGPKRRTHHRAQSASRDVARASKSFPRRAKTTSSLVSRARRGNHPSDLSLAPHISTKSSKRIYIRLTHTQKKSYINLTHHFFLTVRGEHRGRRRALRVRHRRHNGVCMLSGRRRRRRLRFQVAFERLLVKGFRERHDDDLDDLWTMML